ncbi:SGNH/GDSL hydrolase family protein [Allokutzneria sp. NRRL B-24872]|uniref:SGNH/GDSL hydrolase family protein n=1 Tax=Allokutzneria sp. NRRL B-24872 TaxID=1137961 RepID=UPI000A3A4142|nr:SGNH/GDSL hydrolase family protein [Allokutzneria sp. NRRL B-24872]
MRFLLAVVCLLSLLSAPEAVAALPPPARTWLVLGDSYSSGEGIQDTATPTEHQPPDSNGKLRDCRRADGIGGNATAWAPSARREVAAELRISRMDFMACTGAITDEIPSQIAEARERFGIDKWDIVTFSIGGNNIKFADVIKDCVNLASTWRVLVGQPDGCKITSDELRARVDMLAGSAEIEPGRYRGRTSLPEIYEEVAQHVKPGGHVVVLGYPNIIEDADLWQPVRDPVTGVKRRRDICGFIWRKDVPLLRAGAAYLNQRIQHVVKDAAQRYESVGIQFDFLNISQKPYEDPSTGRHSVCSGDTWLYDVKFDGELQLGKSRDEYLRKSFHPNQRGHDATGKVLADHLRERLRPKDIVQSCPDIGFTPNSGNGTFDISSAGVPCTEIESTLREVYDSIGFSHRFQVNGFDCWATGTRTDGLITRIFRCAKDRQWFTFRRE